MKDLKEFILERRVRELKVDGKKVPDKYIAVFNDYLVEIAELIKTHDRELVKEVLEKVSIELENETETYCEIRQCNSPHYQGDYIWFNYVKFRKLAEKLQEEFEK